MDSSQHPLHYHAQYSEGGQKSDLGLKPRANVPDSLSEVAYVCAKGDTTVGSVSMHVPVTNLFYFSKRMLLLQQK